MKIKRLSFNFQVYHFLMYRCCCTSAALAVVFDCILPLQEQGMQVRIVQPSKHSRKVFEIVGLSEDVAAGKGRKAHGFLREPVGFFVGWRW